MNIPTTADGFNPKSINLLRKNYVDADNATEYNFNGFVQTYNEDLKQGYEIIMKNSSSPLFKNLTFNQFCYFMFCNSNKQINVEY